MPTPTAPSPAPDPAAPDPAAPDPTSDRTAAFRRDGVLVVPDLLPAAALADLRAEFAGPVPPAPHRRGGLRGLLGTSPAVRALAVRPEVWGLAAELTGPDAVAVRATLFDKSPDANWAVPWHRDERVELAARVPDEAADQTGGTSGEPAWRQWKRVDGRWTARATRDFLLRMVAVRVRLDDCGPAGGPLRVLAGSHRDGLPDDTPGGRDDRPEVVCDGPAGSATAMCPAALHASGRAEFSAHGNPGAPPRRRVIHLEYAPAVPPGGAAWGHALRPGHPR